MSRARASDRPKAARVTAWATVTVLTALLASACTTNGEPQAAEPSPPPPAPTTAPASPSPAATTPPPPVDIIFTYQPADPECAPVSTIDSLADDPVIEYVPGDTFFQETDRIKTHCRYRPKDLPAEGEGMLLDDHLIVSAEIALYVHGNEDFSPPSMYPELPIHSDDPYVWAAYVLGGSVNVWREGCGSGDPCPDGEQPTLTTHSRGYLCSGRVGNLEFYARITYVSQDPDAPMRLRASEVFRDIVLTEIDRRETEPETVP